MLKIGITGNIGSGKTTVSRIFELLGVPVFYADAQAKRLMVTATGLIEDIKQTFGSEAYFTDGSLNRKHIAGIVFHNDAELAKLNALVHPAVFRAFDDWAASQKGVPYVLKEAALLFESTSYQMCDRTLVVTAPFELRMQRILQRDHITRAEAESRDSKQFSQEKKVALANDMICNDNTQLVIPQVLALHQLYLSLAGEK
jgi:dephospho-CoA kinase